MKVLVLTTYENPKSEEGLKKRNEFQEKHGSYFTESRKKHNVKYSFWSDGTGKMYMLDEYESYGHYAKVWDDEELHRKIVQWCRVVNNVKFRVLRESL